MKKLHTILHIVSYLNFSV